MHPFLPQDELLAFCKEQEIQVVAYSPLGSGELPLINDPKIVELSKNENVTPAQLLLSWSITRQCVVIPKTSSLVRAKENIDACALTLSPQTMQAIKDLGEERKKQGLKFPFRLLEPADWWGVTCFEDDNVRA